MCANLIAVATPNRQPCRNHAKQLATATLTNAACNPVLTCANLTSHRTTPSDPGDETIIFALRCGPHGVKGTYVAAYGAAVTAIDAEMVERLKAPKAVAVGS